MRKKTNSWSTNEIQRSAGKILKSNGPKQWHPPLEKNKTKQIQQQTTKNPKPTNIQQLYILLIRNVITTVSYAAVLSRLAVSTETLNSLDSRDKIPWVWEDPWILKK